MSYSRWSHSCWYTYSTANQINGEPTLQVQDWDRYPLSALVNKESKERILDSYRKARFWRNSLNYHGEGEPPRDHYTEEEIQELDEIMDKFVYDYTRELSPEMEKFREIL